MTKLQVMILIPFFQTSFYMYFTKIMDIKTDKMEYLFSMAKYLEKIKNSLAPPRYMAIAIRVAT
ncbi:hypothetical protein J7E63_18065 [Bacillus sp. ISL-75]|nr:hypothetical protein [Bacillus sp. ISL-75]